MERRINEKISGYIMKFKQESIDFINSKDFDGKYELINFIKTYSGLVLTKDDFVKRKRVKNVVPFYDRCIAKKACGNQCTRRRLKGFTFCGTHCKSQPYGVIDPSDTSKPTIKKVSVWAQDIRGIIYYLDNDNNVYDPSDVINNRKNPKVIAKYTTTLVGDKTEYHIPDFDI